MTINIDIVITLFLFILFIVIFKLYNSVYLLFYILLSIFLTLIINEVNKNNESLTNESLKESKTLESKSLHKQIDYKIFIGFLIGFSVSFLYIILSTESIYIRTLKSLIIICVITFITSYSWIIKQLMNKSKDLYKPEFMNK